MTYIIADLQRMDATADTPAEAQAKAAEPCPGRYKLALRRISMTLWDER